MTLKIDAEKKKIIKKYGTFGLIIVGIIVFALIVTFVMQNNSASRELTAMGTKIRDNLTPYTTATPIDDKTVTYQPKTGVLITGVKSKVEASDTLMSFISKSIAKSYKDSKNIDESGLNFAPNSFKKDDKAQKVDLKNWYGVSYHISPLDDAKKNVLQKESIKENCVNTEIGGETTQQCVTIKKEAIYIYYTSSCSRGIYLQDSDVTITGTDILVKSLVFVTSFNQALSLKLN
ncbi:MAG: hypothetical protein RSB95_03920 [Bacilli bacterium]